METSETRQAIEKINKDGARDADLEELVSGMSSDDLIDALKALSDSVSQTDGVKELEDWSRTAAGLLLRFALRSGEPFSAGLADAAAMIMKSIPGNEEAAGNAGSIQAVLEVNPSKLAGLYEQYRDVFDSDTQRKLLRVITALGEPDEVEKYAELVKKADGDERERKDLEDASAILAADEGPVEDALRLLERYLDGHPADREALALISKVLARTERTGRIDAWYERALDTVSDEKSRSTIFSEQGKIRLDLTGDVEGALGSFEAAVEADKANEAALNGLLVALRRLDRLDEAIPALTKVRGELAGQADEAKVLPVLAEAYEHLEQRDEAERAWRRLRALDPRNGAALRFYEGYHESREDYQKLFTTLQFALSVTDDPEEKIRVNKKMAEVAEHRLHNLERAIESLKRVLILDPQDLDARESIVTLFEKTRKWHALVEFYNERLRRTPPEEVDVKVDILFRIIGIYQDEDKFPNEDNVLANYARVVELSPTNEEALDTLARGYESRERWPDLLRVLQKKVSVTEDTEELLDLFHQIAEIAIKRMSNETQAIPFLEKILELDTQNLDVVRSLKEIYRRKHNQEKLFSMHLKELEMQTGPERESVLASAAAMARDKLLRYEEALRLYEELYELNPDCREARENMNMLYSRLEKWSDYARFLNEEVGRSMPEKRRVELRHRLGEVLLDRMGDADAARKVYETILDEDPSDDLAARRLEQVFLEQEDLKSLCEVFRKRNDMRSYVALLAQRESHEEDVAARVSLNLAMAETCEKDLDEPGRAARFLEKAWSLDKTLIEVGRRLLEIRESQGEHDKSAEILKYLAPSIEEPTERLQALTKLHGDLDKLGRGAEAFDAGREAVRLAIGLGDPEPQLVAVRRTADRGSLWNEYAELLEEVASAVMDHEKRVDILLELGKVYKNRLLFHDEARDVLEKVLDHDAGNLEALGMLEDIALQREDYVGLESVLRRRVDVAGDPDQVRDITLRLGRLYEDLLGDDAQAADCYMQVLEGSPEDREVLGGLHRTYERSERYMELTDVIRMEVKASGSEGEIARLKCELARISWESMDDFDEAIRLLTSVLEGEKQTEEAVAQLKEMFEGDIARDAAANVMAPYFRIRERFDELEWLLKARFEDMARSEAKAAIMMEIADIYGRVRSDASSAFGPVMQAVDLNPGVGYVERLFELAEETGREEEAAFAVGRWVGITPEGAAVSNESIEDAETEAKLSLHLGRFYANKLDNAVLAVRAFEKALPFQEEDEEFLKEILELYRRVGDMDAVMATYGRLADSIDDEEGRRKVQIEKAAVAREAGLIDQAVETLQAVLDAAIDEPEVASDLEDILAEAGRWGDLVRALERREMAVSSQEERSEILLRMATIQRDRLDRPDLAARMLRRALTEDESNGDARLAAEGLVLDPSLEGYEDFAPQLVSVLEQILRDGDGNEDRMIAVLGAKAEMTGSKSDKAVAFGDIAAMEEARGNHGAAFEAMCKAFKAVPEDQGLLERILDAGRAAGEVSSTVEILQATVEKTGDDAGFRILMTVAGLYRMDLEDRDQAREIYDGLLERRPGSVEVLGEIDSLLSEMGLDSERIPVLGEMATNARSVEEKREIDMRIGELSHSTGDLDGAVKAYENALERRPAEDDLDEVALKAGERLLGLYDNLGRKRRMADLRLLMGRTSKEPDVARAHLLTAGILLHGDLDAMEDAAAVFDEMIKRDPGDVAAIDWAKKTARENGDSDGLERIIKHEMDTAANDEGRIESLMELAVVYGDKGEERALEPLGTVLEIEPLHEDAREMVVRFMKSDAYAMEAAVLLEETAVRSNDDELLAEALDVRVDWCDVAEDRTDLRMRLSECYLKIERGEDALRVVSDAYRDTPVNETVFSKLVERLEENDRIQELANLAEEAIEQATGEEQHMDTRLKAAVSLVQAGFSQEASGLLEANCLDDAGHLPTLELLEAVYTNLEDYEGVIRTLDLCARVATGDDERIVVLLKCARLAVAELDDEETAVGHYRAVLDIHPLHDETIAELAEILERKGDKAALHDLRRNELMHLVEDDAPGAGARIASLRRLLALGAIEAGDQDDAVSLSLDLLREKQPTEDDISTARRIYSESDHPPELYEALVGACEAVVDRDGLLDLHRFAAGLNLVDPPRITALKSAVELEEALDKQEWLFEDLAALVAVDAEDPSLRKRLESTGRHLGRLEEVKDMLVEAFGKAQDKPVAFELTTTIARLLRDDLDGLEEAVEYMRVAFLRKPDDTPTIESLTSLYEELSRFGDLALLYEDLGDMEEDGEKRVSRYFEAFKVVRNNVKDPVGAADILKKILDEDPSSSTALEALEAIARETNDNVTLAQSLSGKAEVAQDSRERVAILLELADVQAGPIDDPGTAVETLCSVMDADPSNEKAHERLKELYTKTQRFQELADLYEKEADEANQREEQIDALKKASAVYETHLEDTAMAVDLLRRVKEIDPANTYSFVRLTEMMEKEEDHNALATLLKEQLSITEGTSEQVELNVRIGRLMADKMEDSSGAVTHFKAALAADPYNDDGRSRLEKLVDVVDVAMEASLVLESVYESSGEHLKLCDVLRREMALVDTTAERETLFLRIADLQIQKLDDNLGGLETMGEALRENPANADTLEALEKLGGEIDQMSRLYGILDALVSDAQDTDVRSRLHWKAALIADRELKNLEAASNHYAAFIADNDGDAEALQAMDRVYSEMGRGKDLADVLRQRIGQGREGTEHELRLRLAELLAGKLEDAEGAVEQLRQVLDLKAGDKEAIRQLSNLTEHPVVGRNALELMSISLRGGEDDEGLLWVIQAQIRFSEDGSDVAALHDEAAAVAHRLGDTTEEMNHLGQALKVAPSDETMLVRMLTASKDAESPFDAYQPLVDAAGNATWDDLKKSLLLHAANVAKDAEEHEDEMEACLRQVLEIDPMCREALDILDVHFEEYGKASDLVDVLQQKQKLDMSAGERKEILIRIADLHAMRREPNKAAVTLEEASGMDPSDIVILRRLCDLYEGNGDNEALVSALERIAAVSSDTDERIRSLLDAANIKESELGDKIAARGILEVLFGIDPRNAVGRSRLEELYQELGDWEPLMTLLSQVSDGAGDLSERATAAMKAASIAETQLEDLDGAVSLLKKAAGIDSGNVDVIDELIRLYYRMEDWPSLIDGLRLKAGRITAESERVALLAKACDLAQGEMGDMELAGTMAKEILAIDQRNDKALVITARLMEEKGDLDKALDLFRRLSEATGDMDERAEALTGIARILVSRGDRGEEAKEALQAAARIKPDHPDVSRYLRKLYLESGDQKSLIEVMQRDLKKAVNDDERASVCMDIADIFLKELNDGGQFLQWAEEAQRYRQDDPRVVSGIVDYHLDAGNVRKAVPHLEWLVNYLEGKRKLKELPPYAYQLGRIFEDEGKTAKAIQYYRLCHDHDASNITNALALGRLYMSNDEHEKALRIYQPLIVRIDSLDASARVEVLLALASINAAGGDKKKARQYVLRVLSEEPDNVEAQALLSKGL